MHVNGHVLYVRESMVVCTRKRAWVFQAPILSSLVPHTHTYD